MEPNRQHGFTLLEVLIAMAIIGIGLITLLTLFPIGLRSSRLAGDFTIASLIGQQALDNIRASAQAYDPADSYFDNTYNPRIGAMSGPDSTDHNGLGYYELPISAVKCYFSPIRFPLEPTQSQYWEIEMTSSTTYQVTRSTSVPVGTGTVGYLFTATDKSISFFLYDNRDGSAAPPAGWGAEFNPIMDKDYEELTTRDKIRIYVEMRGGVPYYWYAMRAPVTEDADLDGILDGRMPWGITRSAPNNQVQEDSGLDLLPDFYDTDMRNIGTAGSTVGYTPGVDKPGEFAKYLNEPNAVAYPGDPHGDNRYAYNLTTGWFCDASGVLAAVANPSGTEGNGQIDSWPDDYIQKVTVTVGWREGGQDRIATFSASVPNQFR